MNEMELLSRLREEVPLAGAARAEGMILDALRGPGAGRNLPPPPGRGAMRPRSTRRLAVAGVLCLALATGVVLAETDSSGSSPHPAAAGPSAGLPHPATTGPVTVQLLAENAAAGALAGPHLRPGQWVYRKIGYADERGKFRTFQNWLTADTSCEGSGGTGKVCGITSPWPPGSYWGSAIPSSVLRALPADPAALVRYLTGLGSSWTAAESDGFAFQALDQTLQYIAMPAWRTAEIYRALADIRGVTLDTRAVDSAGRHGVAFRHALAAGPGSLELIFSRESYRLMGAQLSSPDARYSFAYLRQAFVSGPGVLP